MKLLVWLGLLCLPTFSLSQVQPESHPRELTDETFYQAIKGVPAFIKFYAPWCGHCKSMAPAWDEFAAASEDVYVASVDCTKPESKQTCDAFEIRGYPSLRFIKNNIVHEYNGARDLEALKAFADQGYVNVNGKPLRRSPPSVIDDRHVVVVGDNNITTLEASDKTVILKFYAPWCGHCKNMIPAYNQLATFLAQQHPNIVAAKCDATVSSTAAKRYHIRGFPILKVLKDGQMYDYSGGRDYKSMLDFVLNPTGETQPVPGPWGMWNEISDALVTLKDDIALVVEHKQTASVLIFVAGVLSGTVLVILVSCMLPKPKPKVSKPQPGAGTKKKN